MAYSELTFDAVADLLVSQEQPKQLSILQGFEDYVIALSLESGLPVEDARTRLIERMTVVRNSLGAASPAQKNHLSG